MNTRRNDLKLSNEKIMSKLKEIEYLFGEKLGSLGSIPISTTSQN